jgi:alpha-tubulin suppressor-like RCC1 family protein
LPALIKIKGVCYIAAAYEHSLAVTRSGSVFSWGSAFQADAEDSLKPRIVEGFGDVSVRRVAAGKSVAFAISQVGELIF